MTSKSPAPPRIGNSIAAGAAWMVGLRMLDRLVGVISLTILAWRASGAAPGAERHILATLEGIFTARQLRASS